MDKYEEVECIGAGNYGSAHLVIEKKSLEKFVVKKISTELMTIKEKNQAHQEVALLSKLKHLNIVEYKENFVEKNILHIVMAYCEGGDLGGKIKQYQLLNTNDKITRIDEKQILDWFVQMIKGIQYLHNQRILHRDLKTSNIFLKKDTTNLNNNTNLNIYNIVKIGDFGISKLLDSTLDQAKTVVGTPYYLSPEVCESKPYSYASDIWSLGCILYELCSLKRPFEANNLLGLVFKIVQYQPAALPDYYSKELNNLVFKILNKNPIERPTIDDILKDSLIQKHLLSMENMYIKCKEELHTPMTQENELIHLKQQNNKIKGTTIDITTDISSDEDSFNNNKIKDLTNIKEKEKESIILETNQVSDPLLYTPNTKYSIFEKDHFQDKKTKKLIETSIDNSSEFISKKNLQIVIDNTDITELCPSSSPIIPWSCWNHNHNINETYNNKEINNNYLNLHDENMEVSSMSESLTKKLKIKSPKRKSIVSNDSNEMELSNNKILFLKSKKKNSLQLSSPISIEECILKDTNNTNQRMIENDLVESSSDESEENINNNDTTIYYSDDFEDDEHYEYSVSSYDEEINEMNEYTNKLKDCEQVEYYYEQEQDQVEGQEHENQNDNENDNENENENEKEQGTENRKEDGEEQKIKIRIESNICNEKNIKIDEYYDYEYETDDTTSKKEIIKNNYKNTNQTEKKSNLLNGRKLVNC